MAPFSKHVRRLIGRGKEKRVEQGGEGSCSPASATTAGPTKISPTSTIPAKLSSDPQSPHHSSTTTPCIRPADQLTVSATPLTSESADLWYLAYNKFRNEEPDLLGDYDKHVLGDAAVNADLSSRESVQTALEKLLEDREKKQWKVSVLGHDIKIRAQVGRLIKILQWSDPLVKDAVSTQPYAALAWSGVSLLLPLLTSSNTQNEAMLEGFNSIGELQEFWEAQEETSLQSEHQQRYQRLIEPLVKLYSLFFAYQARVICHLSKSQLSRAWEDLRSPEFWTNKLKDINELSESCCKLIGVSREKEIQENRDSQLQEIQRLREIQEDIWKSNKEHIRDEQETGLLQALAEGTGEYARYKNLNEKRVPGTCEWFLTDGRFRAWRDNQSSSLLWVSAGPGYGKSVLSRFLIDDGQLATSVTTITITPSSIDAAVSRESTVCFFFFKDQVDDCMNSTNALCAILHQLFTTTSTSGLIKHALKSHREYGPKLTKNFFELWRILLDCVTSPDAGEIICVLDALDECKEDSRQEFIEKLKELYSQSERQSSRSSKLKFLVTSRPYFDLESSFQAFRTSTAYLRFDGHEKSEQIHQEINLVIDVRFDSITRGFTPEDRQKIIARLKSMNHRTYLWLHLTLDIIRNNAPDFGKRSDIEKLLSHLPSQVSDAYETILSRSKNESRTKTFLRIMLAATRPLTLDEANFALTLAIQETEPKKHAEVELWPRDTFQSIVTNLCGLFVSVYDSKLSFIHQTAREFLLDSEPKGIWQGRFNMPQSHSIISRSCLLYLLLPDIDRLLLDDRAQDKQYPYLAYAATYWPLHFISREDTDANASRSHARTLCKAAGHQASIWVPRYFKQGYFGWSGWTDLALASYLGLCEVVQDILINENIDVDIKNKDDDYRRMPLHCASKRGHVDVVKLLLEKGADPVARDNDDWTPLVWASRSGSVDIVRLLLEKGADPAARANDNWTPLHQASWSGSVDVVRLLLEKGADPVARDNDDSTPLVWASWSGSVDIVRLLLEKGADPATRDSDGWTPLHQAPLSGSVDVARLLLEKGADPAARDNDDSTPLHQASRRGRVDVVRLLLEKGADPAARANDNSTPLHFASMSGSVDLVKLLLEKGADPAARDNDNSTPLVWASRSGSVDVVELLLEKGADPAARANDDSTPLVWASRSGSVDVVELLSGSS